MANNELVVLLREGTTAGWNRWRNDNPGIEIDLTGADLRGANLTRANLAGVDMTEANVSEVSFARANLTGAKLRGTVLWRANFNGAVARDVDGKYAGLRMAHLIGADFANANLEGTDAQGAVLHGTKLANARLAWADLGQTDIDGVDFTNANLGGATFRGARVVGASFQDADLTGIDLSGAFERGSRTEGARQADLVADERDGVRVSADGVDVARLVALLLDKEHLAAALSPRHSRVVLIVGRFSPRATDAARAVAQAVRATDRVPVTIDGGDATPEALAAALRNLGSLASLIVADEGLGKSDQAALATVNGLPLRSLPLIDGDGANLARLLQP